MQTAISPDWVQTSYVFPPSPLPEGDLCWAEDCNTQPNASLAAQPHLCCNPSANETLHLMFESYSGTGNCSSTRSALAICGLLARRSSLGTCLKQAPGSTPSESTASRRRRRRRRLHG